MDNDEKIAKNVSLWYQLWCPDCDMMNWLFGAEEKDACRCYNCGCEFWVDKLIKHFADCSISESEIGDGLNYPG